MATNDSIKFKVYAPGYQALSGTNPNGLSYTLGYCVPVYDPKFDKRTVGFTNVSGIDFLKENGITNSEWWGSHETVVGGSITGLVGEKIWLRGYYDVNGRHIRGDGYSVNSLVTGNLGLLDQAKAWNTITKTNCWRVKPYRPMSVTAASGSVSAGVYEAVIPADAGDFVFNKLAVWLKQIDANGAETGVITFFGMIYSNVNLVKRFNGYGNVVNMVLKINVVLRANITSYDDYVFFSDGWWKSLSQTTIGTMNNIVGGSEDPSLSPVFDKASTNCHLAHGGAGRWNARFSSNSESLYPNDYKSTNTIGLGVLVSSNSLETGDHLRPMEQPNQGPSFYGAWATPSIFLSPFIEDLVGADVGEQLFNVVWGRAHQKGAPTAKYRKLSGGANFLIDMMSGVSSDPLTSYAPSELILAGHSLDASVEPRNNFGFGAGLSIAGFGNLAFGFGAKYGTSNIDSITHGRFCANVGQNNMVGTFKGKTKYGLAGDTNWGQHDWSADYSHSFGLSNELFGTKFTTVFGNCNRTMHDHVLMVGNGNDFGGDVLWETPDWHTNNNAPYDGVDIPSNVAKSFAPRDQGNHIFGTRNHIRNYRVQANASGTADFRNLTVFGHRNRLTMPYTHDMLFFGSELSCDAPAEYSAVFGYRGFVQYIQNSMAVLRNSSLGSAQGSLVNMDSSHTDGTHYHSTYQSHYAHANSTSYGTYNDEYSGINQTTFKREMTNAKDMLVIGLQRSTPTFNSSHVRTATEAARSYARIMNGTGSLYGTESTLYSGVGAEGAIRNATFAADNLFGASYIISPSGRGVEADTDGHFTLYHCYSSTVTKPLYDFTAGVHGPASLGVLESTVWVAANSVAMIQMRPTFNNTTSLTSEGRHVYMYLPLIRNGDLTCSIVRVISIDAVPVGPSGNAVPEGGDGTYYRVVYRDSHELTSTNPIDWTKTVRFFQRCAGFISVEPQMFDWLFAQESTGRIMWWITTHNNFADNDEPYILSQTRSWGSSQVVSYNAYLGSVGDSTVVATNTSIARITASSAVVRGVTANMIGWSRLNLADSSFTLLGIGGNYSKPHLINPLAATSPGERWQWQVDNEQVFGKYGIYDALFVDAMGSEIHTHYMTSGNADTTYQGHSAYNRLFGHNLYIGADFFDGSMGTTGVMYADLFGMDISVLARDTGKREYRANNNLFARGVHMRLTRSDQFVMGKLNVGDECNWFEFGIGGYAYNDTGWQHRRNGFSLGYLVKGDVDSYDYAMSNGDAPYNGYNWSLPALKVDVGIIHLGNSVTAGVVTRTCQVVTGDISPENSSGKYYAHTVRKGDPVIMLASRVVTTGKGDQGENLSTLIQQRHIPSEATMDWGRAVVCGIPTTEAVRDEGLPIYEMYEHIIGIAMHDEAYGQVVVAFSGGPLKMVIEGMDKTEGGTSGSTTTTIESMLPTNKIALLARNVTEDDYRTVYQVWLK